MPWSPTAFSTPTGSSGSCHPSPASCSSSSCAGPCWVSQDRSSSERTQPGERTDMDVRAEGRDCTVAPPRKATPQLFDWTPYALAAWARLIKKGELRALVQWTNAAQRTPGQGEEDKSEAPVARRSDEREDHGRCSLGLPAKRDRAAPQVGERGHHLADPCQQAIRPCSL